MNNSNSFRGLIYLCALGVSAALMATVAIGIRSHNKAMRADAQHSALLECTVVGDYKANIRHLTAGLSPEERRRTERHVWQERLKRYRQQRTEPR